MFSKNALTVLEKRYLLRDESGQLAETTQELFARVAKAVASAEQRWVSDAQEVDRIAQRFFQAMINQCFMPNSPTLMNAGKEKAQLSACFVLPVPDSLDGIFETCKNAALIHKTGGGTGFSFNRLRPANDRVATTTGVASGPVSFMTVYDAATEAIRQGGTRRGANMGILNIDHPDIEKFITCKRQTDRLNNFNISVAVNEQFMSAVAEDRQIDLIHPGSKKSVRTIAARELFEMIVENAHATGEPGIVFLDRINAADPIEQTMDTQGRIIPGTEDIEATNPCGEQPLGPGDACTLGSINVAAFVDEQTADFKWDELAEMVALAVRFLDDVVETNVYPLDFIARATLNNRRIGLGIMGWAEALIRLNVAYNSEDALQRAEQLMSFIQSNAHSASSTLAEQRGNFPNYPYSTWAKKGIAMRNATVVTIAPTGTISIIAGTTSGIEPVFAVSYIRRVLGGMELVETDPLFEQVAGQRAFHSEDLMRRIALEGTVQHLEGIPEDVKKVWVCSHDISYVWHVRMQAAFQKYTDCAVSKTINLPAQATLEDVRATYLKAWELGLKGITVYRDTSRNSQVLNLLRTDPSKKADFADLLGTATSPPAKPALAPPESGSGSASTSPVPGRAGSGNRSKHDRGEDKFSNVSPVSNGLSGSRPRDRRGHECPECGASSGSLFEFEACLRCRSCGYTKC